MIGKLINLYKRLRYVLYETGDYNVNLFGIRNSNDTHSNGFNDYLGVLYKLNGEWKIFMCAGTTDPGLISRTIPVSTLGTAILPCGQYPKMFRIGKHKGQYEALVQNTPVALFRDRNKDGKLDFCNLQPPAMCGINFHRANAKVKSKQVDGWSAGCQVVADPQDFAEIMRIIKESAKRYGSVFTYTLFDIKDLV